MSSQNHYGSAIADYYDLIIESGYYDHVQSARCIESIIGKNRSILELGVGTGLLAKQLIQRGHKVTGVDVSPAMLAHARRRLKNQATLHRQDVTQLSVDDYFDIAVSEGAIWMVITDQDESGIVSHLLNPKDNVIALKRTAEHLRRRGKLLLSMHEIDHDGSTISMIDGHIYEQRHKVADCLYHMEYVVRTRHGKTIAQQQSTLRYFSENEFDTFAKNAGFRRQHIGPDTRYFVYRKAG